MSMKVLNVISYATLFLTFTIICSLSFMYAYDHTHPPSVTKTIYNDSTVKRGSTLIVLNEVSRFRDCRVISSREITNLDLQKIYELDPIDMEVRKSEDGKVVVREVSIDIPKYMVPGNYTYQSVVNYYCTPANYALGPIVIRTPLIRFKVTE